MFLRSVDQSLEMRDKLAAVDTACDVEYQGSRVYKDIHIIVGFSLFGGHSLHSDIVEDGC